MLSFCAGLFIVLLAMQVKASPATTETLALDGLREPVEILKDNWGISHIYARNEHDLFFAQGFNAARDRLFQFEIWRRRATGTLAEIQGEKALAHDRGARLLRFRGDLQEEMAHYHVKGELIVTAFVKGINAYIALTRQNLDMLPFEFELLGITPGDWTPAVVLSRHNALTGGISTELMLAELITGLGPDLTEKILPFERKPYLDPLPGIELADMDRSLMKDYTARAMPAFDSSDLAIAGSVSQLNDTVSSFINPFDDPRGSNNWVIDGSLTKSGKPLMANDPHRSVMNPSLRYMVHLNGPGWNVIGGGEPVLPGVSIGHNEHGAWGLTIFRIDQEDLYVYETNPDNPNQYRYKGQWRDMEVESTTISVRDADDVTTALKYTVHGPVLKEDPAKNRAYAMKAAWLEVGAAPYLASLRMDQATSWEEFRAACAWSGLPGENMVWADKYGNIGWQSVGYTPIRFGWEGRLPVWGNGEYEWHGLVPITAMPHIHNPDVGYYGTANHNNVPKNYPNIFADFYSDPARSERLDAVLSVTTNHSIEDSKALQYDNKSMTATDVVPVITSLRLRGQAKRAQKLMGEWDYHLDRDSAAGAIYDHFESLTLGYLNEKFLPGINTTRQPPIGQRKMREWFKQPPEFVFGPNPAAGRDRLASRLFNETIEQMTEKFGEDMSAWRYGDTHYAEIHHPLQHLMSEADADRLTIGPLPRGGAANTLNANRGDRQYHGGTFRMIVDTGDWDAAVGTNSPGQSGDPRSKHYSNLFRNWNEGSYFPMYFSREKIETATDLRLNLLPQ